MWPNRQEMQVGKSTGRGGEKPRKGPPIKGRNAKRPLGPVARESVVASWKMVEAVGIEPTSEDVFEATSTSLAGSVDLAAGWSIRQTLLKPA